MEVMYERCAALDVHKKTVAACLIVPDANGRPKKEKRVFKTMTQGLLSLSDWLLRAGCTHVAMERRGCTGSRSTTSWKLTLKSSWPMPARGSFIPPKPIRALRDLIRYRTSLVRQKASEVNRLQKFLEDANIKLASVATDITGVSAKAAGRTADGEKTGCRDRRTGQRAVAQQNPGVAESTGGPLEASPHHKVLLTQILAHIDYLDEAIAALDAEIEELMHPFVEIAERLDEIPGVDKRAVQVIVAEIGVDMDRFPTAGEIKV